MRISLIGWLVVSVALISSTSNRLNAAEAHASSGGGGIFFGRNHSIDLDEKTFYNPTGKETITWESGTNTADEKSFNHEKVTENKFTGGPITANGRIFDGVAYTDGPGKFDSFSLTFGQGASACASAPILGKSKCVANWVVVASGELGSGKFPSWTSKMSGNDPYYVTQSTLANDSQETTYGLFFPAGFGGNAGLSGEIDFNVYYDTFDSNISLLSIILDSSGGRVSGDEMGNMTMFRLDNLSEDYLQILNDPSRIITMDQVRQIVQTDALDHDLSMLYILFRLDSLPIPSTPIQGDVLASYHVDIGARDLDARAIPEPSTWALMILGFAGLGAMLRWRRRVTV